MNLTLTIEQKMDLLKLARITIAEKIGIDSGIDKNSLNFTSNVFKEKYGAFVTIHKKGTLRGCIGYIKGIMPLKETIIEMANSAAFKDPRFSPLKASEYRDIDLEISVMSPIETVKKLDEIVVGRDGLIISSGFLSGLLLPQVATEYNWNREDFLSHTCMKAGLPQDAWKDHSIKIEKFSALVFSEKDLEQ